MLRIGVDTGDLREQILWIVGGSKLQGSGCWIAKNTCVMAQDHCSRVQRRE